MFDASPYSRSGNKRLAERFRFICLVFLIGHVFYGRSASADAALPLLTTFKQVRALTSEEASRHYPVHVQATVTEFSRSIAKFFLQDSTSGIFFEEPSDPAVQLVPGMSVDVTAVTGPGSFTPIIMDTHFRVTGTNAMPRPRHLYTRELGTGVLDGFYMELKGQVRAWEPNGDASDPGARPIYLAVATESGRLRFEIAESKGLDPESLIGAEIVAQGVWGVNYNLRRQLSGEYLSLGSSSQIQIVRRERTDPAQSPLTPILSLLRSSEKNEPTFSRVRVRGKVTLSAPGHLLVIQSGLDGLRVETRSHKFFALGSTVDAIGFPALGGYSPLLQDAIVREVSGSLPMEPAKASTENAIAGEHDYQLIAVRGEMIAQLHDRDRQVLWIRTPGYTFPAILDGLNPKNRLDDIQNGSLVELNGICVTTAEQENKAPIGFRLLLRSDRGVLVLREAPWWNSARLLQILGGTVVLALGVFGWNLLLRRRVKRQLALIERQMKQESSLERRYRDLFEHATDMIYTHDLNGRFTSLNHAGEIITGYSRAVAQQSNLFDWAVPEQRTHLHKIFDRLRTSAEPCAFELEISTGNNVRTTLEITSRRMDGDDGTIWIEGIARECTERKRSEQFGIDRNTVLEMVSRNEGLPQILSRIAELVQRQVAGAAGAVMMVEGNQLRCAAAPSLCESFMHSVATAGVGPATTTCGAAVYWGRFTATEDIKTDPGWGSSRESALQQGWYSCWSAPFYSAQEQILGTLDLYFPASRLPDRAQLTLLDSCARMVGLAVERRDLYDRLTRLSQHDVLTGLPNRLLMEDRLTCATAQALRNGHRVGCIYIDLDGFKQVNDTFGHKVGDQMLQACVEHLRANLGERDTLARIGGDEFLLVLPEIDHVEQARFLAQELIENFRTPFEIDGQKLHIGASIGISVFPDHGEDNTTLQRNADAAMYCAKRKGKGRVEIFAAEIYDEVQVVPAAEPETVSR